jgi:Cu2+-containing amine oxidase
MTMLAALLLLSLAAGAFGADDAAHPLDPLGEDEISTVVSLLRDAGKVDDDTRYPQITLDEPPKGQVLAWKKTDDPPARVRGRQEGTEDVRGRRRRREEEDRLVA